MKKKSGFVMLFLCILLTLAACNSSANKEVTGGGGDSTDFPKKPITFIVPWAAGGGSDLLARSLAESARDTLGTVVIQNREGANGTIATTELANKGGDDGYTIILGASGLFTAQPYLRDVNYSLEDFKGVLGLTYDPIVLAVNADSPWETLDDLLSESKSGKSIKYGHSGAGSFPHLAQANLYKEANIDAKDVPYEGANPALMALLGGHIDTIAGHPSELISQHEEGKIRILGVFSPERYHLIDDVPTMKEKGFDIDMSVWKYILVHKDTPDEIVAILEEKLMEATDVESFTKFMEMNNQESLFIPGDEVIEKLAKEAKENEAMIKEMNISINN